MLNPNETICVLITATDPGFLVKRTFNSQQTAWYYEDRLKYRVSMVIVPGNWKIGDLIPFGTPMFSLYSYARDRRNVNA
jgi:hypothetical protein